MNVIMIDPVNVQCLSEKLRPNFSNTHIFENVKDKPSPYALEILLMQLQKYIHHLNLPLT